MLKKAQNKDKNVRQLLKINANVSFLLSIYEVQDKLSLIIPDSCFEGVHAAVISTVVQLLSMRRPAEVSSDTSFPRFISANNSPEWAYFAVLVATPFGASR